MNAIVKAFDHVKHYFPRATYVIYTDDLQWCFMDDGLKALDFSDTNIDVGILEDAAEAVGERYRVPKAFMI